MFGSLEHPLAPISRTPPTRRTQRTENFFMTIGCRFYKESSTVDSVVKYILNEADTNARNASSPPIFPHARRYRTVKTPVLDVHLIVIGAVTSAFQIHVWRPNVRLSRAHRG